MIKDTSWIRQSFMLPSNYALAIDARRDLFRNVAFKFTDTTLGGNFAINPPPQFTKYADLVVRSNHSVSRGMGRYYSEAIDDNGFDIHMGFGVAAFNSLTQFFTSYYSSEAASIARTGKGTGVLYSLGKVAGFALTIPVQPIILAGRFIRFLMEIPSSKYYYLKPTMANYWSAVNQMTNMLAANMKMVPFMMDEDASRRGNAMAKAAGEFNPDWTQDDVSAYHQALPNIYREDGAIDVFAVANRAQRLNDQYHTNMMEAFKSADSAEAITQAARDFIDNGMGIDNSEGSAFSSLTGQGDISINNYLDAWEGLETTEKAENAENEEDGTSWRKSGFFDFLAADLKEGSRFVTFRVNNGGDSVSESVSNSTKQSELAGTINSISNSAREKRFSLAGGNVSDGAIGQAIEGFIGGVTDFAKGALDGIGMSGLMQLGGSAFADIPEMWDDSSFNFPTSTYTVELRSPYGNKMARMQNLYIPLSMLLAAALPLSTGSHSYTSPFLVELYSRGRNQIRLGIIDSMEITRGVGNLGWTAEGEPLGIDVSFTVKDLSSVMHMPIRAQSGFIDGAFAGLIDDDTPFTDYMATLSSLSLADQYYVSKRMKLSMARRITQARSWLSPARYTQMFAQTLPGRALSALARYGAREGSVD